MCDVDGTVVPIDVRLLLLLLRWKWAWLSRVAAAGGCMAAGLGIVVMLCVWSVRSRSKSSWREINHVETVVATTTTVSYLVGVFSWCV